MSTVLNPNPVAVTEYASSRHGFTRTFNTLTEAEAYINWKAQDLANLNGTSFEDALNTFFDVEFVYS